MTGIADLPAYHRRVLVMPREGSVSAWVEDDYHHMGVTLTHDGETVSHAGAEMVRAPWTTCPGAVAQLSATFDGMTLADAARAGGKKANCTHLHDMATLAAAHAGDSAPTDYAIVVTDPVDGRRIAEISRGGEPVLRLVEQDGKLVEPAAVEGRNLFDLTDWINSLPAEKGEVARLLRWGAIIAHGRSIPLENQSDASRMPPNCFTFQPERREKAVRVGRIVDFSAEGERPLETLEG